MISPRANRPPLTHEHAMCEVARCAGTQFDPVVAEAFLDVWADGWDTWQSARAS